MMKLARLALVAALGALPVSAAFAVDKIAAKVNDVAIPQARVDAVVKDFTAQGQPDSPQLRQEALDRIINFEILSQEAAKKGLDKDPDITQQLELAREGVLARAFVQDYAKNHPVSEDALKQEYDRIKQDPNYVQYRIAHIVVSSEAEAKAIEAQLKKKAKFETLAKQKSQDPRSKDSGGELPGWHTLPDFPPAFADAVHRLKKGEISEPVQAGDNAWHIIKVEDIREVPPFEESKSFVMQRLQDQAVQKLIAELRKNAKVEGVKTE